CASGGFAYW
nr:immunoglobulin heavy chain junction region [Mus musculus]NSM04241.1 immunoglobulin heavy chain junction region [Mus musculus]NSM04849.1 immunoglobulin heavy chain junction region [Mus musculus]NSM06554.1 immunoglobulin heavy chain junction region [Mus musculus]NSM08153.1 immunoglobulin heavy chain junction region [Mus musculus]